MSMRSTQPVGSAGSREAKQLAGGSKAAPKPVGVPPLGPVAFFQSAGLKAQIHLSLGQRPRLVPQWFRTLKVFLTSLRRSTLRTVRNAFSVRFRNAADLGRCPRLRCSWAFSPNKATGPLGGSGLAALAAGASVRQHVKPAQRVAFGRLTGSARGLKPVSNFRLKAGLRPALISGNRGTVCFRRDVLHRDVHTAWCTAERRRHIRRERVNFNGGRFTSACTSHIPHRWHE